MTGQDLIKQALRRNQLEADVETINERLLTRPMKAKELFEGMSNDRKEAVQGYMLTQPEAYQYLDQINRKWHLKRKP